VKAKKEAKETARRKEVEEEVKNLPDKKANEMLKLKKKLEPLNLIVEDVFIHYHHLHYRSYSLLMAHYVLL
jgi:hypothetical protein